MATRCTFDFSRHHEAAVRVYLQHWMIQHHLGFLIHPKVDILDKPNVRVMDIACGTGIWLVDVAAQLSKTARLDGNDISPAHFPLQRELPANVHLSVHNASNPFPPELHGQYDLVHVGRISMYVHNENPQPILNNIVKLLKPGGYLQWDDLDVCGIYIDNPTDLSTHSTDIWRHYAIGFFKQMGCGSDWLDALPQSFTSHKIAPIESKRVKIGSGYAKPWTSMQLMANRDFTAHDIIPATKGEEGWPTAEEWEGILDGVERECAEGVRPLMDITYTVGQMA